MVHLDLNISLKTEPHAINLEEQSSWAAVDISSADGLALTDVTLIDPEQCIYCWFMDQYQEWQKKPHNPHVCIHQSDILLQNSVIIPSYALLFTADRPWLFSPFLEKNQTNIPTSKKPKNQNPPKQAQNKQTKLENHPRPVSENQIFVEHVFLLGFYLSSFVCLLVGLKKCTVMEELPTGSPRPKQKVTVFKYELQLPKFCMLKIQHFVT